LEVIADGSLELVSRLGCQEISTWREANGQYGARCLFRDYDGITRPIERTRQTKAAAERALKEALHDRGTHANGAGEITT
jgi:hypothetical protein